MRDGLSSPCWSWKPVPCPSASLASSWSLPTGSLDRWPEDYERGRPGWPPEVVDVPGLSPTATVLELGAGTGKLTRLLFSTFGRVVAVEPEEAMVACSSEPARKPRR